MKLVVGLGNPGDRFNFTRHNFGFLTLDFYLKRNDSHWDTKPFLGAIRCKIGDTTFIKPQDFYNLSGQSVASYVRYYKIPASDILVICDNFDLEFGKIRFRSSGSTGGNNGLKSIDKELSTSDYPRLRLGTENTAIREKVGATDFVLGKFTPEEKARLPEILEEACDRIDEFIAN
ncbi:aminoacyl-tRNA hydrolase [Candidatus Saccharibacteria bacterium]|nr:aminoacyl-tRNA hydrolase [Candidatus Saccharibacteria bacterium]